MNLKRLALPFMKISGFKIGLYAAAMLAALTTAPVSAVQPSCSVEAKINPKDQNVPAGSVVNDVFTPTLVHLNGEASKPNNATFLWELLSEPSVTLSDAKDAKPTFTAPNVPPSGTTVKFRLTVTGCNGQTSYVDTTITLSYVEVNRPPVASATVASDPIYEGYSVTLNGTASSDPDGDTLTYTWEQIEIGTDTPVVTLTGANTAIATFMAPNTSNTNGYSLKFRLTVSDGSLTNSTDKIVNVIWVNDPPVASVTCPHDVNEGGTVMLNGSASTDYDNGIASYEWSQTEGGPIPDLSAVHLFAPSISFVAPQLRSPYRTMSFKLTVTDKGTPVPLSSSAECDVIVNDVTPPDTSITGKPTNPTNSNSAPFNFTGSDAVISSDLLTFECQLDNASYSACTSPKIYTGLTDGSHTFSVRAIDEASNKDDSPAIYTWMVDTTPPIITASVSPVLPISGWWNIASGVPTVTYTCDDPLSGSGIDSCTGPYTFPEGANQSHTGTAVDKAGNSAPATVSNINVDLTAPTIVASVSPNRPASGWWNIASGAPTVAYTCNDSLSGIETCTGSYTFPEGANQSHTGTAVDRAGNNASATVSNINVDLTTPTITWNGGPAAGSTYYFGFVPVAPTCTTADALSGANGCVVSGYSNATGTHTMIATAQDKAGNSYSERRTYTVSAWTLKGFYQPVDMSTSMQVYNTVKNGSTVPIKFEVFAGSTELTDVTYVKSLAYAQTNCDASAIPDDIDTLATGNTALRYDTTVGQYIYNWKTPSTAGKCYRVTMTTIDDSSLVAYFKLK